MCTAFLYPKLPRETLYTQGKRMGAAPAPAELQAALGLKCTSYSSLKAEEELVRQGQSCPESHKCLQ